MFDELFPAALDAHTRERMRAPIELKPAEPPLFRNFFGGSYQYSMRSFAEVGRGIDLLGATGPIMSDAITGGTEAQDRYFKEHDDIFNRAVDYWTPQPGDVGAAGQVVGSVIGGLGQVLINPGLAVGTAHLATSEDLVRQGVDAKTANSVGAINATSLAIGMRLPFLGKTVSSRMLTGAGGNVAEGVIGTAASREVLIAQGYERQSEAFDPWDAKARTIDILMGLAFGGLAHRETLRARKQMSQSDQDAVLTLNAQRHLESEAMPNQPKQPWDVTDHVNRVRTAMDQVLRDEPVNVAKPSNIDFEPHPARQEVGDAIIKGMQQEFEFGPQYARVESAPLSATDTAPSSLDAVIHARQMDLEALRQSGFNPVEALRRTIANSADGKSNVFTLEARTHGIADEARRHLQDAWIALGKDWLGFVQDAKKARDLITEIKGGDSGNAQAKKGAQAWRDISEEMRQRFNDAGGRIARLADWGMPQHHAQEKIALAGREAWKSFVLERIDRNRYPYSAAELSDFLDRAWHSLATNGATDIEIGQYRGRDAVANRHREHREIHFKDAQSTLEYWQHFGDKSLSDVLLHHVDNMAREIAMVEHFGPNPDQAYRSLRDQAEQTAKLANPQNVDAIDRQLTSLDNLFDYAAGRMQPVASRNVARFFEAQRNLNTAGMLGSAFWASFWGDKVMLETMSKMNHLPAMQRWRNELRLLNPANAQERRLLQRQGLMLDYMRNAMFRFGDELGSSGLTGKLASAVMRVSGMNAINEWRRGAFGLSMMSAIGHEVAAKDFHQIGKQDMRLLTTYGITANDWQVWRLAKLEDYGHGNETMLTPEAIARIPDAALKPLGDPVQLKREAITKLLGALHSESDLAIITPRWSERAMMLGGLQRGRVRDEIMRSIWQFKSFPIAQFKVQWELASAKPSFGGKFGLLAPILIMQTLTGAMMLETQDMLTGKDPRPMDDWKFWAAAMIKGGSLGIYGDFLYSTNATTRYGTGPLEVMSGPTVGRAADAAVALIQAGNALSDGRDTHLGAKLARMGKTLIPGQNLWYTKAATDHIIFQNIQEALSPGYLNAMRDNTMREYQQRWWWEPGEFSPSRAPNLEAITGE